MVLKKIKRSITLTLLPFKDFMRESILHASLRTFFVALFWVIGITAGLILVVLLFSLAETTETTPSATFTEEIVPNADGERKILSKSAPVILRVNIEGTIGELSLTQSKIENLLVESREGTLKNDRVKAILLFLNTPGGTVSDADGIYRALLNYKKKYNVPVYAFVDGMCASGGMYVASAADKIYATNVSLIGSVGVIAPSYFNLTELMTKVGVQALTISAGKGKDELNPLRPWKEGEDRQVKELIDYYYAYFVDIVTKARPQLSRESLVKDYGAAIFPARKAEELGFIDHADSSYSEALRALLAAIGIDDNYYQVVQLSDETWYKSLFQSKANILNGEIKHTIGYNEFSPKLMNQYLYLYKP